MTVCYVTDRKALSGNAGEQTRLLLEKIEHAAKAGLDWIQIREKDLSGRDLAALAAEALRRVPRSSRILVNDRMDVALACRVGGVHFGEQSLRVAEARRFISDKLSSADFLVGASVHSVEAARIAQQSGADYVIFGPIFETPSKISYGRPQGLAQLADVCRNVPIPVLAIGGITLATAHKCMEAGATGIAAIRLFQDAENLETVLAELRAR